LFSLYLVKICSENDVKLFIDEVINKDGDIVPNEVVFDSEFFGWRPSEKHHDDFVEISLAFPIELSKIQLIGEHNTKYYTVLLIREDQDDLIFEVKKIINIFW
jgi:hypothetical protein